MRENVTLFDKPYPIDKQAEGLAVSYAVISGDCDTCKYLRRCSDDRTFAFPADAPCMAIKAQILKDWGVNNG